MVSLVKWGHGLRTVRQIGWHKRAWVIRPQMAHGECLIHGESFFWGGLHSEAVSPEEAEHGQVDSSCCVSLLLWLGGGRYPLSLAYSFLRFISTLRGEKNQTNWRRDTERGRKADSDGNPEKTTYTICSLPSHPCEASCPEEGFSWFSRSSEPLKGAKGRKTNWNYIQSHFC